MIIAMKRTSLYVLITIALISVSCEDYLEVESLSVSDLDYVFSNREQARNFVNSIDRKSVV